MKKINLPDTCEVVNTFGTRWPTKDKNHLTWLIIRQDAKRDPPFSNKKVTEFIESNVDVKKPFKLFHTGRDKDLPWQVYPSFRSVLIAIEQDGKDCLSEFKSGMKTI